MVFLNSARVMVKIRQLSGTMGRASGVLDGGLLLLLYNGMVLPDGVPGL